MAVRVRRMPAQGEPQSGLPGLDLLLHLPLLGPARGRETRRRKENTYGCQCRHACVPECAPCLPLPGLELRCTSPSMDCVIRVQEMYCTVLYCIVQYNAPVLIHTFPETRSRRPQL